MWKRIVGWAALALGALAVLAHWVTPWPSVLAIRLIFDSGSAAASSALEPLLPADVTATRAVRYSPTDPDALMDIYRPARLDATAPVVVWVHGGGFVSGRRQDIGNYLRILASRGFVTVSVDYTIAPEATYPTPVRQVTEALHFLDRNGERLGLADRPLVLAGDSAGAQIAAQVAAVATNADYARRTGIDQPFPGQRIAGVLLYCGVFDLSQLGNNRSGVLDWFIRTVTWAYSGERDWRDRPDFAGVSIVPNLRDTFPPSFISAGNADPLLPQSQALATRLTALGVPVETLFFPPDYQPALGHEYQFDLRTTAGRRALDRSVEWLADL